MLHEYRKKTTIKAEQFDIDNLDNASAMYRKYHIISPKNESFILPTKEGNMVLCNGDWIATGIDGEHWVIADSIFKRTYERVD